MRQRWRHHEATKLTRRHHAYEATRAGTMGQPAALAKVEKAGGEANLPLSKAELAAMTPQQPEQLQFQMQQLQMGQLQLQVEQLQLQCQAAGRQPLVPDGKTVQRPPCE